MTNCKSIIITEQKLIFRCLDQAVKTSVNLLSICDASSRL